MQNSRVGRQTGSKRAVRHRVALLMSIVLLIALFAVPSSVVQAQVQCLGACEEQFAACRGRPNQDLMLCQDSYEICVDSCLGSFTALLG